MKALLSRIRSYWFSRLLWKYFWAIVGLIAVPVTILNVLWTGWSGEAMEKEMFSINEQMLLRSAGMMDSTLQSIKDLTYCLAVSEDVRYMAVESKEDIGTGYQFNSVSEMLKTLRQTYEYIDGIYVYCGRADAVLYDGLQSAEEYRDADWMQLYLEHTDSRYVLQTQSEETSYPWSVCMVYPIGNYIGGGRSGTGAVAVEINMKKLGEHLGFGYYRREEAQPLLIAYDGDTKELFYIDERRLLRDEREEMEALEALRQREGSFSEICRVWGTEFVASGFYSKDSELQYIYLSPVVRYVQRQEMNHRLSGISGVLSVLLSFVAAFILAILGSGPVIDLTRELEGGGNMDNGMKFIRETMLSMRQNNSKLNSELEQRMVSLKRAQLSALQAQINPHFIYNTIMAISGAVARVTGAESSAVGILETFADLMRISLNGSNYLVPLSEELEHIRLFGQLVAFRYKERVHVSIDIPEEMTDIQIPKLSMQPLIENSIHHGIRPKHYYGCIRVSGSMEGDMCRISVRDDGVGISEERQREINAWMNIDTIERVEHIGLRNVNQRLKLIFGEQAGISVRCSAGMTEVMISFPAVTEDSVRKLTN